MNIYLIINIKRPGALLPNQFSKFWATAEHCSGYLPVNIVWALTVEQWFNYDWSIF